MAFGVAQKNRKSALLAPRCLVGAQHAAPLLLNNDPSRTRFLFFLVQFAGEPFELVTPVEFPHLLRIFPPIRRDFHEKPEVDFAAQDRFQFFAGFRSDLFEHFAFVPNQYFFLRIAFHVHERFDAQQLGRLFIFFNRDRQRVRHLVVRQLNGLFTNDLGGQESFRLVGHLIFGKVWLSLRQLLQNFVEQLFAPGALQRGDRQDGGKFEGLRKRVNQRQKLWFRQTIDFVHRQNRFSAK